MTVSIQPKFPQKFSGYIFLSFIWLLTGFALGALILLWPLRIWVNYTRDNDYSDTVERAGVIILIVILLTISFRISLMLFQWHVTNKKMAITILSLTIPLIASASALYLFMNPDIVNKDAVKVKVTERFTIGPYPDEEKIKELKKEGYTAVISLLHPAVVPFEPELLKQEEILLKKYGMQLIKAPMLPWISENSSSLQIIEDLVKKGNGKYYIHCYLGKDRVNVAKNLILRLSGSVSDQKTESSRTFEGMRSFERGNIYKIDSACYMPPYPTDEEFLAFFLAGHMKTVVNLMDSNITENKSWIRKEKNALQPYGITFKNVAVNVTSTPEEIENTIDSILLLPKPMVVHHWNTTCPESKLFRKLYYQKTHYTQTNLATNEVETFFK
jgi:protein tyrosine phosphatase (PTP) superfamily phosphohydrolase (DUF442 family)